MSPTTKRPLAQIFVIFSSFSLVSPAPAQILNNDRSSGLSGSVYVLRLNNRQELSVPPMEDLQRVWNWLNSGEVQEQQGSAPPQSIDRSIGEFLKNRSQSAGNFLGSD